MNTTNVWSTTVGLRALFYMVPPSESQEHMQSGNFDYFYTKAAIPWFYILIFIDFGISWYRKKHSYDIRDGIGTIVL